MQATQALLSDQTSLQRLLSQLLLKCALYFNKEFKKPTRGPGTMCLMMKHIDKVIPLLRQPARCTNVPSRLCILGKRCAREPTILSRSTGAYYWPTYGSDGLACHCTTTPPHCSSSTYGRSKPRQCRPCNRCVTWSPAVTHLAIVWAAHHRLLLRCTAWKRSMWTDTSYSSAQPPSPRLAVRTWGRRCESGAYVSRDSYRVWVARDYPHG